MRVACPLRRPHHTIRLPSARLPIAQDGGIHAGESAPNLLAHVRVDVSLAGFWPKRLGVGGLVHLGAPLQPYELALHGGGIAGTCTTSVQHRPVLSTGAVASGCTSEVVQLFVTSTAAAPQV